MADIRCQRCNRLLGKALVGTIEIKCPRCGRIAVYNEVDRPIGADISGENRSNAQNTERTE